MWLRAYPLGEVRVDQEPHFKTGIFLRSTGIRALNPVFYITRHRKSIYRPGLKIFERAQVHKGLGWQRPGALWYL
jgi:hypothetical protein